LVLMTQDHIMPRSKGGANRLENLQTMCCVCNNRKGNSYSGE
jgi:5-methylcytosine-specific restriction endonuclease McrA